MRRKFEPPNDPNHQHRSSLWSFYLHNREPVRQIANGSAICLATTISVLGIQLPAKKYMVHCLQGGRSLFAPRCGLLGALSVLYKGGMTSFGGSVVRTGYVKTAKRANQEAENYEHWITKTTPFKAGLLGTFAGVDVLLGQYSNSITGLIRAGTIQSTKEVPKTWHNLFQLMRSGLGSRFSTSLINLAMISELEPRIASGLSLDKVSGGQFVSGMMSGVLSGMVTTPLTIVTDLVTLNTTMKGGNLHIKPGVLYGLGQKAMTAPWESFKQAAPLLKKTALMKGLTNALIFGAIAGVAQVGTPLLEKINPPKPPSEPTSGPPTIG